MTRLLMILLCTVLPVSALAADVDESRIKKLEQEIQGLQRSMYGNAQGAKHPVASSGTADVEVRFTGMEERMREMAGRIEELDFQNRQLKQELERYQKDTQMRFSDIERANPNSVAIAPVEPSKEGTTAPVAVQSQADPVASLQPSEHVLRPQQNVPDATGNFNNPKDHYNYAFRLLNQTQYEAAERAFKSFISTYPKDPLIGNAYYWAGETHYVQQEYGAAIDNFRQGFEILPNGPKAGDNLLKLAMSLGALKRNNEACAVLGEVVNKFGGNSVNLKSKAQSERSRLSCE